MTSRRRELLSRARVATAGLVIAAAGTTGGLTVHLAQAATAAPAVSSDSPGPVGGTTSPVPGTPRSGTVQDFGGHVAGSHSS